MEVVNSNNIEVVFGLVLYRPILKVFVTISSLYPDRGLRKNVKHLAFIRISLR